MGKKSLNRDDISIWKKVTETVTPILRQSFGVNSSASTEDMPVVKKKNVSASTPKPALSSSQSSAKSSAKSLSQSLSTTAATLPARKQASLTPADLDQSGFGGISRAGARSIKSGQRGYTTKIDLHGLSREKAHIKLRQFLQSSATNGHRDVLVITGKGTAGKGVIRSYLPVWLNEPPLSDLVIAYCQAQPKDGGGGAWYVNLRT